ncbi:MAG: hypothetical protein PHV68_08895, partial [Candidatus Gastranaerophilales bacterium]|nr:hypothetical protein [Candidatus Gastranaerophilales bacterium]
MSKNSLINDELLQKNLNLINTTSPSYPIIASIEGSIEFLNSPKGKKKISKLLENIDNFKKEFKKSKNIEFLSNTKAYKIDETRIFAKVQGYSGHEIADLLFENDKIEVELDNNIGFLALCGIGTTKKKFDVLKNALIKYINSSTSEIKHEPMILSEPIVKLTPKQAYYSDYEEIKPEDAIGKIVQETIVPYPP